MKKTRRKEYDTFEAGVYKKHFYGKEYEYERFIPSSVDREYTCRDSRVCTHLEESTGFSRNRIFTLHHYLRLFDR